MSLAEARCVALVAAVAVALALSPVAMAAENGRIAVAATTDRLVTMNADGGGAHVISFAYDLEPAWSPDGSQLAVASLSTGNGDVYVLSPNGKRRTQVTRSDDTEGDPSWAPCGCLLAFTRTHDGDSAIYTVTPQGTDERLLADARGCDAQAAFSPDGTRIAFASCREGLAQIYVMNADGSDLTRLTHDQGTDANPAWSPDGRQLAFDSTRGGQRQIWVMATDGTGASAYSPGPLDEAPAWSPDGLELAYDSGSDLWVHVMSTSGPWTDRIAFNGRDVAWQPVQPEEQGCSQPGTTGDDYLAGGDGSDVVCGGAGDDEIVGGPGSDVLRGGDGNDLLDARDGAPDVVDGGSGFDTALVDHGDRVVNIEDVHYVEPRNLARGRPTTASSSFADGPPSFANDGYRLLWWASYYAPQWIEIDLGRRSRIRRIELVVAQTPPGETLHVVRGRGEPGGPLHLMHVFRGFTQDKDVLAYTPRRPWRGIESVRIDTLASPSWVAWKEIRILR